MLLTCYFAYVSFMAYNQTIEKLVKTAINRKRIASSSSNLNYIMQVRCAAISLCPVYIGGIKLCHSFVHFSLCRVHSVARVYYYT